MSTVSRVPATNSLLAALPYKDYQLLLARLEPVTLTAGEVLYRPGEPMLNVYFPTDSLVSLFTPVEGHQPLEVGMIGHEGMLGIALALGVSDSPVSAIVQGAGVALRMSAAHFKKEFQQNMLLQREVYSYTFDQVVQLTQAAACNRLHHVEARLASRLLMTRDRVRSNQFHLTQDLLGNMLGVRRSGVTKAAGDLRQRGLISYSRGEIRILDDEGLAVAACHCYQVVKDMRVLARS